jgi:Protein of unknown function (DUF664)
LPSGERRRRVVIFSCLAAVAADADQLGQVPLRWIYVNIISEHARHAGHADILREQIDGATGD